VRADNTRHIIAAARQRRELTRAKAIQALRTLDAAGTPVTFETVARAAAVSRSWLYAQPDIRAEIERLRAVHHGAPATHIPARQRASDASLLRRLEAASQRNKQLAAENRRLREQLALALGSQRSAGSAPQSKAAEPAMSWPATQCHTRHRPGDGEEPPFAQDTPSPGPHERRRK
jgi:hypothetical protein